MNDNFFVRVYHVVKLVPKGRVTTYGAIARYIGSPQSSRMVGWALNNSGNLPDFVPAHRVVNRLGMLSGKMHFRTPDLMQQLLENEGIKVENDCVVGFNSIFWDPYKDLV